MMLRLHGGCGVLTASFFPPVRTTGRDNFGCLLSGEGTKRLVLKVTVLVPVDKEVHQCTNHISIDCVGS